jgi:hypothetical protein
MDVQGDSRKRFFLEMKICRPVSVTGSGDWFTRDTSSVNFAQLGRDEVHCGKFEKEGEGKEVVSGHVPGPAYNRYGFSNQVFAWENILVFRITDRTYTGTGNPPRMYVFLPVRYKSFVTFVSLEKIPFADGKVLDLSNALATYKEDRLTIHGKPGQGAFFALSEFAARDWVAQE